MKLHTLSIDDQGLVTGYLAQTPHTLSTYHFINILSWTQACEMQWAVIREALCIFYTDRLGRFMYLPPLGKTLDARTITDCFSLMDGHNPNRDVSRIENVEESQHSWFIKNGFTVHRRNGDYLYERNTLADLKGDAFKSKRASCNAFRRQHKTRLAAFQEVRTSDALALYEKWRTQRGKSSQDSLYTGMLSDGLSVQTTLLRYREQLPLAGLAVFCARTLIAYTFGYRLNHDTFCIAAEVCDLNYKGVAQYIFREFARQLAGYRLINTMDDSGLDRLAQAKQSYHPSAVLPAYTVSRLT